MTTTVQEMRQRLSELLEQALEQSEAITITTEDDTDLEIQYGLEDLLMHEQEMGSEYRV